MSTATGSVWKLPPTPTVSRSTGTLRLNCTYSWLQKIPA
jgi:hypothetical protein